MRVVVLRMGLMRGGEGGGGGGGGSFKADAGGGGGGGGGGGRPFDAVNEENPERDRATQV